MMIPRPYQRLSIGYVNREFVSHRSTLLVLATGLGKTVVFSTIAHEWTNGRVMVIAHREELIDQAAEKIAAISGDYVAVEMGDRVHHEHGFGKKPKVIVASKDTLKGKRLEKFNPDEFGLLIIDEAHHAIAASYRGIIDHFSNAKILGVTATPKRHDQFAMEQVFETVAFDYGIEQASLDGWLVPVRQRVVKCDDLDFSAIRTTAGDLNEGDLATVMMAEKALHAVAAPAIELCGDQPTLVFCVTVDHATRMAEILNRYKEGSAIALSGTTQKEERRNWVGKFKAGQVQYLCNCGLFLEGFDAPQTANIIMARPTKSLPLYTQVIGRMTRPLPGIIDGIEDSVEARRSAIRNSDKPYATIFDFAGNAGRHKLINAADVLGGRWGTPARAYAKELAEDQQTAVPVDELMERASDELEFLREQEEVERRAAIKARAEYRTHEVNVFAKGDASFVPDGGAVKDPPTAKMINYLVFLGIPRETAEKYSRKQAHAVINKLKNKRAGNDTDDGEAA